MVSLSPICPVVNSCIMYTEAPSFHAVAGAHRSGIGGSRPRFLEHGLEGTCQQLLKQSMIILHFDGHSNWTICSLLNCFWRKISLKGCSTQQPEVFKKMKTHYGDEEYTAVQRLRLPPGVQLKGKPDKAAAAGNSNGRSATGPAPIRPQRPRKSEC